MFHSFQYVQAKKCWYKFKLKITRKISIYENRYLSNLIIWLTDYLPQLLLSASMYNNNDNDTEKWSKPSLQGLVYGMPIITNIFLEHDDALGSCYPQ